MGVRRLGCFEVDYCLGVEAMAIWQPMVRVAMADH